MRDRAMTPDSSFPQNNDEDKEMSISTTGHTPQYSIIATRVESAPPAQDPHLLSHSPSLSPFLSPVAPSRSWPGAAVSFPNGGLNPVAQKKASEENMMKVWRYIDNNPVDSEDAEVARAEIIYDLKEMFTATFSDRPEDDKPIDRSVDHCLRETTQVLAWILMRFNVPNSQVSLKPWAIHYKHTLLELMYEAAKWMGIKGFKSKFMVHINDARLELAYNDFTEQEIYKLFYSTHFKLLDGSRGQISKFDNNLQLTIPSCYGYEDTDNVQRSISGLESKEVSQVPHTIGGEALKNVVENYLALFDKQSKTTLGAHNITVFLGEYDSVNVPLKDLPEVAKKKLEEWKEENKAFIESSEINISTFAELAETPYYKAADKLLTLFLLDMLKTKRVDLARWIAGDISRYLEKIGKNNPNFTMTYKHKVLTQSLNNSPPKKAQKTSPPRKQLAANPNQLFGPSSLPETTSVHKAKSRKGYSSKGESSDEQSDDSKEETSPRHQRSLSIASTISTGSRGPSTPLQFTHSPQSGSLGNPDMQEHSEASQDSLVPFNSSQDSNVSAYSQTTQPMDTVDVKSPSVVLASIFDNLEHIATGGRYSVEQVTTYASGLGSFWKTAFPGHGSSPPLSPPSDAVVPHVNNPPTNGRRPGTG
jgi:hypothetical protein